MFRKAAYKLLQPKCSVKLRHLRMLQCHSSSLIEHCTIPPNLDNLPEYPGVPTTAHIQQQLGSNSHAFVCVCTP